MKWLAFLMRIRGLDICQHIISDCTPRQHGLGCPAVVCFYFRLLAVGRQVVAVSFHGYLFGHSDYTTVRLFWFKKFSPCAK